MNKYINTEALEALIARWGGADASDKAAELQALLDDEDKIVWPMLTYNCKPGGFEPDTVVLVSMQDAEHRIAEIIWERD